jgi:hypothetical protein
VRPLLPLWRDDVTARAVGSRGSLLWWLWWHYGDKIARDWPWFYPWRWVCWFIVRGHDLDHNNGHCVVCAKPMRDDFWQG